MDVTKKRPGWPWQFTSPAGTCKCGIDVLAEDTDHSPNLVGIFFLIGQRFFNFFISLATQGEQFPELGIFSVPFDFAALPQTPLSIYHMEVVAYETRLDSGELIFF